MNGSTWRICCKDCRRFWPLAGLAWLLTGLVTLAPFYPPSGWVSQNVGSTACVLRWYLIAFLAFSATQEDSAAGDRAGWVARPITGWQMFVAKLLFLSAAAILPTLIATYWAARVLSADQGTIAETLGWTLGSTLGAVLVFALLGALTRSLFRAVLISVGLYLVFTLAKEHLDAVAKLLLLPSSPAFGIWPPPMDASRISFVWLIGGLAAGLVVLAYQYLARRSWRTIGLAAGSALALWLVGWAWACRGHGAPPSALALHSGTPPIALVPIDTHLYLEQVDHNVFPLEDQIVLGMQMRHDATRASPRYYGTLGQSRLTLSDGHVFAMPRPAYINSWGLNTDPAEGSKIPLFLLEPLGWPPDPKLSWNITASELTLTRSAYNHLRGAHGRLVSWMEYTANSMRIVGRFPLRPGGAFSLPGRRWQIRSLFLLPDGSLSLAVDCLATHSGLSYNQFVYLLLVNRSRNEVSSSPYASAYSGSNGALGVEGHCSNSVFRDTWSLASHEKGKGLDEDWLKDAEVVVEAPAPSLQWPERTLIDWGEVALPDTPAKD
jgi:hypothetical protein